MKGKIADIIGWILIIGAIGFSLFKLFNYSPLIIDYIATHTTPAPEISDSGERILIFAGVGRTLHTIDIIEIIVSILVIIGTIALSKRHIQTKKKPALVTIGILGLLVIILMSGISSVVHLSGRGAKPVIYLYPEQETQINVSLETSRLPGELTTIYPKFNIDNGRSVIAKPDGSIMMNNHPYSYLFREGEWKQDFDRKTGFVIHKGEAIEFLQDSLSKLGLLPYEYNEMIVYWLPYIEQSERNIIHFASKEEYDDMIPLEINPTPDALLRIYMAIKPINKKIEGIAPQSLEPFTRKGFTVVERGGTYLETN